MYPRTQALLSSLLQQKIIPGLSYAIIDGQTVLTKVQGDKQWLPDPEPLRPGLLYDLASLTKVVGTATVIFELLAAGKCQLDDPVQRYLPSFQDQRVTLRHLLTHTSGIAGYIPNRNQLSAPELKKALLALPVTATFEQKMVYTDVGFLYLGWIVAAICQQPIQQVITERVLQPLRLTNSSFTPTAARCVPTTYQAGHLRQGQVHDPKAQILGADCGSAGLFADLADLITFSQWYLGQRPDLPTLVSEQFRQNLAQDWTGHQLGRSLAWDLRTASDGHQLLFHTGFTGTFLLLDLQRQQALIVLSNRVHPQQKNDRFLVAREAIVQSFIQELTD
ncbi:serine hydrolase domain-containing protein [Lapidilactobacillus wuchangensis]|uniref:serine hydrolase domain-containing protein n=1 Tax=Lapidilactobacillus wuchangensis TaxID=2486001 RepID=UPI000F7955D6|nr:serine hydrolase domain-containing protein [Lapidilactobacillus wuchangensis]